MVLPHFENLTAVIGCEVTGLDPSAWLEDDAIAALRTVFDDRGVLLLRNVELDRVHQYYLATILRGCTSSEEAALAGVGRQTNYWISNRKEGAGAPFGRLLYHSDGMWSEEPFEVLSLYGDQVEAPTSPTLFASSTHAWELLPDHLRRRVEGLHAVQVPGPEHFHERRRERCGTAAWVVREGVPTIVTPVAKIHPRTGRTVLFVAENHTKEIVGLPQDESDDLIDELFAHLYSRENTYEHQWQEGDLVLWDNLAIQHARPGLALEGPARSLRKVGVPEVTADGMRVRPSYRQTMALRSSDQDEGGRSGDGCGGA